MNCENYDPFTQVIHGLFGFRKTGRIEAASGFKKKLDPQSITSMLPLPSVAWAAS